jgi:hypothetical protein
MIASHMWGPQPKRPCFGQQNYYFIRYPHWLRSFNLAFHHPLAAKQRTHMKGATELETVITRRRC